MPSSSRTPRNFDARGGRALLAIVPFLVLGRAAAPAETGPKDARVKLIKVWASDQPEKDEKPKGAEGAKDELKDYRKELKAETRKKHFTIAGKVEVQPAVPGKVLAFPLLEDYKLEITPALEGKGDEEKLVLLLSLKKGKEEKRGPYKLCGTKALIYVTPLREEGRDLVVIVQKLPVEKEPAPGPSK